MKQYIEIRSENKKISCALDIDSNQSVYIDAYYQASPKAKLHKVSCTAEKVGDGLYKVRDERLIINNFGRVANLVNFDNPRV